MLRTSGLLSVCCGCPAGAGLYRCRRHPMEVETLVSPNATRSQQCTQMPQTNVERPFSPICVHSYCVFPCGRTPGRDLRALAQPPPQPGGGLLERICPVGPLFIVPRRLAGGLRSTPPGRRRHGKAHSARRGGRRLRLSVRRRAGCAPPQGRAALLRSPGAVPRRSGLATVARPPPPATSRLTHVPTPVSKDLMSHGARDGRRARVVAYGSSQLGPSPRGRRRLGSASSGLKKRREVRLTGSARRMRYTSLLRCVSEM